MLWLSFAFNPEEVILQEPGELVIRVREGDPALPVFLMTTDAAALKPGEKPKPPKDGRYVTVSERGTIGVGKSLQKRKPG